MEQIKQLLAQLTTKQKISIAVAAVLAVAAVMGLSRWNKERDFKPLFTGMSAEDAGAVVQKLKEGGIEYRLSEAGDAVSIPSGKVAESRLELAAAGLPKTGRIGFELFDKTSFGTTEFVEHINYQRALEGELERSIMSVGGVEHTRVHITPQKDSVFLNARQSAKASVMLRLRRGSKLSAQHVQGISHLIASAVEGLAPEGVSILDMDGRLLSRPKRGGEEGELSEMVMEARQKYERDLVSKISANLEPLLGPDGFRASASVEFDGTSAEQSEETFDPTKSVMLTSQKTEEGGAGAGSGSSGIPGTASNLPRPESRPASATGGMSRRTESITYQSSRVVRKTQIPHGSVKRMSVSILVDYVPTWTGTGEQKRRTIAAPTPEMIKSIRDLVAGATGLTPDRGDQLIVESLPFESTRAADAVPPDAKPVPQPQAPWQQLLQNRQLLIGGIVGAVVLLLLLVFAARKMMKKKQEKAHATAAPALTAAQEAAEIEPSPEELEEKRRVAAEALAAKYLPPANVTELTTRVRELAKVDQQIPVAIVRRWLGESES
jgi:flagellar M-ring protein FliF